MRVLIVEDERKTAHYLRQGLAENGFVADVAYRGDDGLHLALTEDYDLVILDVLVPGQDGWSVLAGIRRGPRQTPVLMLTARDAVADRVRGLELGADDYLVKPFAFSELVARVRSILRRGSGHHSDVVHVADLDIDPVRRRVTRGRCRLDLTPKEFALLWLLARRAGEVLTRTHLAEQVWGMNFDSNTNVVDVAIRRLRRKIDEPFSVPLIHTVRGVGYVLEER